MVSSPRTNRGTSIIAALVFAAVLGAIALSLNSLQGGSIASNSAALGADTAAATTPTTVNQSDEVCNDGEDFNYTVSPQSNGVFTSGTTPTQQLQPTVATCPSDQNAQNQIYAYAQKTGAYKDANGTWHNLPKQFTISPGASTRSAATCSAGHLTTEPTNSNLCTYYLQVDGSTYKLKNWMCRVTFYNQYATPGTAANDTCWVKDVPVGGGVNNSPAVSVTTPSNATPNPGNSTVSPDTKAAGTGTTCSNGAGNPPTCDVCPSGTVGGYNDTGGYSCQPSSTPTQPQAGSCSNGANNPPTCNACPGGSAPGYNDAGAFYCQTGSGSQTQSGTCSNGANNPPACDSCPNGPSGYTDSGALMCNATPVTNSQNCTSGQNGGACKTFTGTAGICANGVCTPQTTVTSPPGAGLGGQPGNTNNSGGLGNTTGLLTSFLSGLNKGLSPCSQTPQTAYNPYVGGNGTTLVPQQVFNPTTGTYSTVYVQQQPTSPYGYGAQQQPCGQQAPYGTGNNGQACSAPPAQPQCAAGATAQPLSASGNGCVTGYQCVPTNSTIGQTPTPQLSCSPQVADVGQSVAISYSCSNATGSSASGFSTNNQTSGSATVTIPAPPAGTNTANFGLTCTSNGQSASTQCKVQVNQPAIDLVASPQSVQSGGSASVGWVTAGMKSCVISSPSDAAFTSQNAGNANVNGVAKTGAISQTTEYDLNCTTLGGQTKSASTTVTVGAGSGNANVTVTSTIDGQSVNHGGSASITWSDTTAASSTAAAIWLVDLDTEQASALIASGQASTGGTYTWHVPATGSSCDTNSYTVCASDLLAGNSYGIEVAIYTPQNAYIGPASAAPATSTAPTYSDYGFTADPFSVGQ